MMLDVVECVNFYGKDEEVVYIMGLFFVLVYECNFIYMYIS